MKRTTVLLAAIVFCVVGPVYALYTVSDRGEWPKSWPKELEPLRKQSRTLEGPEAPDRHYAIRFTKKRFQNLGFNCVSRFEQRIAAASS
jgi:hypothetical protein